MRLTFPKYSGLYLRSFLKAMQQEGVCPEVMYPYDPKNYNLGPGLGVKSWRRFFKIGSYFRCYSIENIESELELGLNVFCAIKVHYSFMTHTNKLYYKLIQDAFLGYHAVEVVGFDKYRKELKLLNSYSNSWGENGFFTISYDDFNSVFEEAWSFDLA